MIVIRRMVDRRRAYTAIFLKGEPPKIFPTSDAEHARILQVYKQDRLHEGILNDFSDDLPPLPASATASPAPTVPHATPAPWPHAPQPKPTRAKKKTPSSAKPTPRRKNTPRPLWLTLTTLPP